MNVLIACEESAAVREAFTRRGHFALSCDLLPTAIPGNHYQGDVFDIINGGWDLMVAHPPCTFLSSSGLHWNLNPSSVRYGGAQTQDALDFVRRILAAPIKKKALENPIGCIGTQIRPADQIIQPWQFGHDASKATCLWLEGLPMLKPTKYVEPKFACKCGALRFSFSLGKLGCPRCGGTAGPAKAVYANQTASGQNNLGPSKDRAKERSKTYTGIADAMAEQWGASD